MYELNALYYPEIACLDERVLKYLLLLYDKIYFLPNDTRLNPGYDTIPTRFSINDAILNIAFGTYQEVEAYTMYACENNYWNDDMKSIMASYEYLEENEICLPIQDEDFEDPMARSILEDPVRSDINDKLFTKYCQSHLNNKMKLPDPNKYGDVKGGGFAIPALKKDINPLIYFSYLCSERINNSIYLAGKYNLVPISKNFFFQDTLNLKLSRITSNPKFYEEEQIDKQIKDISREILSWEITNQVVPTEVLMNKSVEQILRYKNEALELQQEFRSYIMEVENLIIVDPWNKNYKNEVNKKVELDILPELDKIQDSKRVLWEKLFGDTIDSISTNLAAPAVGMKLITNLNFLDILVYSTIIWAGSYFPKIRDFQRKSKESSKHALFYLMNFSKSN